MQTFRVRLSVRWEERVELGLPLAPVHATREPDGAWTMDFDVEGASFDEAAGRLWGEAAACGLHVQVVEPVRSQG